MNRIHILIAGCVLAVLLMPRPGLAVLEGRSFIDESIKGFRLYKRPKVTVPTGWKEHEAAGQEIRGVVLVPEGKDPRSSDVMVYAIAIRKEKPSESLQSFIKEDIDNFKNAADRGEVTKIQDFNTASGKLIGYQFSYNNEGKRFFQTSAFGEEDGHFLSFVLTGKSKVAHDSGLNLFKQLISVYR